MSPPPAHRATTAHLQALYPFVAEGGLGERGVYIGRDLFGGAFVYDAWELYGAGVLTNPNMVVLGQIGRGKSSFVKSLVWRQQVFGRQAWVVDPKGEYGPLAEAAGATSLRVAPGGAVRLNPLQAPGRPAAHGGDALRRQGELLCSLAAGSLGRPLLPHERTAAELAVARVALRTTEADVARGGRRPARSRRRIGSVGAYRRRGLGGRRPPGRPRAAAAGPRRPGRHVRRPHERGHRPDEPSGRHRPLGPVRLARARAC